MAFLSKLIIDETEYTVLKLDYSIEQAEDGTGLPNERAIGGKILVEIESVKSVDLIEWANSNQSLKDGELILYNRDSVSTFRKIEFKGAYCLKFRERFDGENSTPLYSEVLISARELNIMGVSVVNDWPENV